MNTTGYLFAGDNACFIKFWNGSLDLVSLDWLKENGDINTRIWSVKKTKFVHLPDITPSNNPRFNELPITRIRNIDGLVDVIDTCPQSYFSNLIWSNGRNLVNPMSTREGDISDAYLLGLFFVLGEIYKDENNKYQIVIKTNKIATLLDFQFHLKNNYPHLNIPSYQSQSKWVFKTELNDKSSENLANYWFHIFYLKNLAQSDLGIKRVPKHILNSSFLSKKDFIRGYLDAQSDFQFGKMFICESKIVCAQLFHLHKCLDLPITIVEKNTPYFTHFVIQLMTQKFKYNGVIERKSIYLYNKPCFYQITTKDKFTIGVGDGLVL